MWGQIGVKDKRAERGVHDRPASGQTIGGRAGRGGEDQAVGPEGGDILPVDIGLQLDHPGQCALVDDRVIHRDILGNPLSLPVDRRAQQDPLGDFIGSLKDRVQGRIEPPPASPRSRNPRPPRLTPRIGTSRAPTRRATDKSVPSPPRTRRRSTSPGRSDLR